MLNGKADYLGCLLPVAEAGTRRDYAARFVSARAGVTGIRRIKICVSHPRKLLQRLQVVQLNKEIRPRPLGRVASSEPERVYHVPKRPNRLTYVISGKP